MNINNNPSQPSNDKDIEIIIRETGEILFVHDDDTLEVMREAFPDLLTTRASHVEMGEDGLWRADMSPLQSLFETGTANIATNRRDLALKQEVDFVRSVLAYCQPRKDAACTQRRSHGNAPSAPATSSSKPAQDT